MSARRIKGSWMLVNGKLRCPTFGAWPDLREHLERIMSIHRRGEVICLDSHEYIDAVGVCDTCHAQV